jgi:hypothetical protein
MTRYRFLNGMGDVVGEHDFDGHAAALAWAKDGSADDQDPEDPGDPEDPEDPEEADVQRVEFLGPEGDWRWAGPLEG